jgi:hypothetical protein
MKSVILSMYEPQAEVSTQPQRLLMSDWLDRIYAHKGKLVGLVVHVSGESERRSASCTFHLQGRHAQPGRRLKKALCQNLCAASLKRYQEEWLPHQETERVRKDKVLAPRVIGGDETVVRSVGGRRLE